MVKIEIEAKFKISKKDIIFLKNRLDKIKDLKFEGVYFERNIFFDNQSHDLLKNGRVLRIRRDLKGAEKIYSIVFKEPNRSKNYFQIREEVSMKFKDSNIIKIFIAILDRLGYKAFLSYEKIREDYRIGDTLISFYILPLLGFYLEIEGTKKNIVKISKLLGIRIEKAIRESWVDLYLKYCKTNHLKNRIFKFDPTLNEERRGK